MASSSQYYNPHGPAAAMQAAQYQAQEKYFDQMNLDDVYGMDYKDFARMYGRHGTPGMQNHGMQMGSGGMQMGSGGMMGPPGLPSQGGYMPMPGSGMRPVPGMGGIPMMGAPGMSPMPNYHLMAELGMNPMGGAMGMNPMLMANMGKYLASMGVNPMFANSMAYDNMN